MREVTGWSPKVGVAEGVRRLNEWLEQSMRSAPEQPLSAPPGFAAWADASQSQQDPDREQPRVRTASKEAL
jgi:hypothetical protein